MKVLQTIASLSATSGGPSTCTHDLVEALHLQGTDIELLTIEDKNPSIKPLGEGKRWLKTVPNDGITPLGLSKNLKEVLCRTQHDIYHTNGIWHGINHYTCEIAKTKGKPYIVSPHGMLYPTALKIHYWKKWPILQLWFKKDILEANCLHVTCEEEARHCRAFGYKGPIAVIPNPVVIPKLITETTQKPLKDGKKAIGFLGRLHPIKKIEQILYSLAELSDEERKHLTFEIMGKYDDSYEAWLKEETRRLQIEDNVEFIGFVSGNDKYDRLQKLWSLMVPSVQENFGMIVPEALCCGTPVYASLGTPWEELNTTGCGWWKSNNIETITGILREIIQMNESECLLKGTNGRKLIENKYRSDIVANNMMELYEWILKGGSAPKFVRM